MEMFLEIIKITLPSLIVFATAYYLLKQYLDDKYQTSLLAVRSESTKITLPLRLQAYERFALLCERIEIPNLLFRVRNGEMKVRDLQAALYITLRQEFEHNASQQIYVSETLWQILTLAKDETIALIAVSMNGLDPADDAQVLVDSLYKNVEAIGSPSPLQRALMAIRAELTSLY